MNDIQSISMDEIIAKQAKIVECMKREEAYQKDKVLSLALTVNTLNGRLNQANLLIGQLLSHIATLDQNAS